MPKTADVMVAGRKYAVTEKVSGVGEKWRRHLRETPLFVTFQNLDTTIEQIVNIVEKGAENLERGPVISIARILPAMIDAMSRSMDDINDLVYDFVPEMAADRDWLRDNAYDSEIVNVFIEVLKINFPILGVLDLIRGLRAPGTSTNLPSMNGASVGTKKNMARLKSR